MPTFSAVVGAQDVAGVVDQMAAPLAGRSRIVIIDTSTSEPQVTRKMCAALTDLKSVAPADRQEPLDRQLRLLDAAVRRAHDDEEDVLAALTPDTEGIGSGADVTDAPPIRSAAARTEPAGFDPTDAR